MALTIVPRSPQQEDYFTNHLARFCSTKECYDKGLKLVKTGAKLVQSGAELAENPGVALGAERVAIFASGTRAVIKLLDVVDALTVPRKNLNSGQFTGSIIQSLGYGVSDSLAIVEFGDDLGLFNLGEAKPILSTVANGFYFGAHVTTLALESKKMADSNNRYSELVVQKEELVARKNTIEANYLEADQSVFDADVLDENSGDYAAWNNIRLDIARKDAQIDGVSFDKTVTALKLSQTVMDIVAVLFQFVLMVITLPLVIVAPIMSLLGFGSAATAIARLWMNTSLPSIAPNQLILDQDANPHPDEVEYSGYVGQEVVDENQTESSSLPNNSSPGYRVIADNVRNTEGVTVEEEEEEEEVRVEQPGNTTTHTDTIRRTTVTQPATNVNNQLQYS